MAAEPLPQAQSAKSSRTTRMSGSSVAAIQRRRQARPSDSTPGAPAFTSLLTTRFAVFGLWCTARRDESVGLSKRQGANPRRYTGARDRLSAIARRGSFRGYVKHASHDSFCEFDDHTSLSVGVMAVAPRYRAPADRAPMRSPARRRSSSDPRRYPRRLDRLRTVCQDALVLPRSRLPEPSGGQAG